MFCSAHAKPIVLVTTMMAALLRPSLVPWQQAWKLPSTALFAFDPSFWGHKGVPPHWRHPQIPLFTQTGMPNLDPFFASSFNCDFQTNDNQTIIVYEKRTLVLYRKGLCGFSSFGICPRRKVTWSKVLQVLWTRGSS